MNALGGLGPGVGLDLGCELDAELVQAARRGSDAAFARIVARHQRAVRAFLRRLGGPTADADDLAQETFLAAWRELDRFRGQSSLRAWLCGIAYRKRLSQRRAWFRSATRETRFAEIVGERGAGAPDDRLDLAKAMAELPLEQRAAVSLCLAGDFSHAEAAAVLHLPLGTVKSHVARGRARLLKALGHQERPAPEESEHERS